MIDFYEESKNIFDTVVACRRDLHEHPEIGEQEFRTSEVVASTLESLGIEVRRGVGIPGPFTGVLGTLHGGKPGPTVALRADMDALPIQEVKDLPYKSQNAGVMHACGHDAHTAILLGTARLLAAHREELKGNVRFIFQPNEERTGGAERMIADGALDGCSAVFGLHVAPGYPTGSAVVKAGPLMAASDRLIIDFRGLSSHGGCAPEKGVDAIVIAGEFISAVQALVSRETCPTDSAVVSFGTIHGGEARNIVCDHVRMEGIIRTLTFETRERMNARVRELAEGIAKMYRGSCDYERQVSYGPTINDAKMTAFFRKTAADVIGEEKLIEMEAPQLGCEDFSYYLQKVPGTFWNLGTGNAEKDTCWPLHNRNFDLDEDALVNGVAMQASLAYRYLEEN